MENKDWRKEFDEKFFTKETFDWKNPTPSEIKEFIAESLLKSKQEEIERAMDEMRKNPKKDIVYCTSYELALDDLKPIISNLLK